jgi:hypothetical protein
MGNDALVVGLDAPIARFLRAVEILNEAFG